MTRPIGHYRHPKPARLHAGYLHRIRTYLAGGLTVSMTARLCGVHHKTIQLISQGLWPRSRRHQGRVA